MDILQIAKHVFSIESQALERLIGSIDTSFEKAVDCLLNCKGRVIVCGMGKSGLIGKKIAATFASTGTPSFFLHPSEAIHGDLGVIVPGDCFVSISNSGETDEILQLIPHIHRLQIQHICLVGNAKSTLSKHADIVLDIGIEIEASPLQAVPMASAITTLAMGDALAACLIKLKNFQKEDFAKFHPGGSLGKQLVTKVQDKMCRDRLPVASPEDEIREVIMKISEGMMGIVAVCNADGEILGVVTDGDLRRALSKHSDATFFGLKTAEIMTQDPKWVEESIPIWEADQLMTKHKITALLVAHKGKLIGMVAQHHLSI